MFGESWIFDALPDFKTLPLGSRLGGDRFVDIGWHGESDERSGKGGKKKQPKESPRSHRSENSCLLHLSLVTYKGTMLTVFYLGPEGTFSHILARKKFGARARLRSCPTFEAIFDHVREEPGTLGLVPIENSSGGTVYDSVDLLIRNAGRIFIHEELALDVRIALLGHQQTGITAVYSHFVQIKHHAEWLKTRYPKARLREVSSTAVAAQKAAASQSAAALASPGAAEIYGLKVLEAPAVRQAVNVTHFFTIGSSDPSLPPESARKKTGLVATLPNVCGSLHRFLGPFARQKVSLARIVSRPVPGQPQTYVFFLEIEGGPDDPPVARALVRAGVLAESMKTLGTYRADRRFKS